ncbi:TetR/AcrR family transcriptional regulator [Microbispora hainanensis]|uniref:TetR/AcrR family transcriptional regulator n=1 Tax=Microbispora hainanensis TaxID=568844 RepID=A0ABZ1T045_9ACTN|nr:TetR/AcrR family transcriptional regulator [Microbispora hainanensis]
MGGVAVRDQSGHAGGGQRRHGAELQRAIFDAVFAELSEVGFARMTMDSVALAAHTGKAALYRRWGNKKELVLDALSSVLPSPYDVELTGHVRDDLIALLSCIRRAADATRAGAFHAMAVEGDGDCRKLFDQRVLRPCKELIAEVLRQGAARGEVASEAADPLVAAAGPALLADHILTEGTAIPEDLVVSVVDRVLLPLTAATGVRGGDAPGQ